MDSDSYWLGARHPCLAPIYQSNAYCWSPSARRWA